MDVLKPVSILTQISEILINSFDFTVGKTANCVTIFFNFPSIITLKKKRPDAAFLLIVQIFIRE